MKPGIASVIALGVLVPHVGFAEETAPAPEAPAVAEIVLDEALVKKGKKVFKKCKACHKVGAKAKNGVGPIMNGIYLRPAGTVEGYEYSAALMTAAEGGLVWDDENLRAFLKKPKEFMPGTKMTFTGLKKEKDQTAVIEYLKSVSVPAAE